jgi:hypothetical protein
VRARLEAEWEEARDLLDQMRPANVLARLREPTPAAAGDSDAATLRGRLEVEKAEARELLARMRPAEVASRAAAEALVPLAVFLVLGILLAKLLDRRGLAHPGS